MKKNRPTVSLIISTYNWVEALCLCLRSVSEQSVIPNEVIIADDGSKNATRILIDEMRKKFPCPLIHIWHEDLGFRLTAIRNKAINSASSDYILQIDGDIILNKYFVEDHLFCAKKDYFATGSRVMLPKDISANLIMTIDSTNSVILNPIIGWPNSIRCGFLSDFYRFHYKKNNPRYMKGCNMAFWRKDLVSVNGYNEDMTGWGYEDNEIAARLINLGIQKQFLKFRGIMYHLYHSSNLNHERKNINQQIFEDILRSKNTYCKNGLDKYKKTME